MNIAVVGTGYVGLVTGTCFAETGNHVSCIDIDADKVRRMQEGEVPIFEPGLEVLFERNSKEGRLTFTTDLTAAVEKAEVVFLALPTPPGEDGSADLKYVLQVADDLGDIITDYKIIVDKSTVPVGTGELVEERLAAKLSPDLFDVVSNPEFLREGVAVDDFLRPARVVIGTESERARGIMERLYKPFVRQGNPIIFMDVRSAEMTKYAANAYLATRITFMNEIANLCEKLDANVDMVRRGIGSDTRIGKQFLFAGIGFGGSCFPKDVQALSMMADDAAYPFRILDAVLEVNGMQRLRLVEKLRTFYEGNLQGKTFAIWGLSFKPNTDDIREAPSLYVIDELLNAGARVKAYDPEAMENIQAIYGDRIELKPAAYDTLENADALLILTEWSVFRQPNFTKMKNLLKEPVIFDGRNLYDFDQVEKEGFFYSSIGRKVVDGRS
jgi:UDPglucose 6-dehydrogenase